MPEIIFSKKEFQMWYFESFIFWSKYHYILGTALGRFSQFFFFSFCHRPTILADIFTQPSPPPPPHRAPLLISHHHHKKASTALLFLSSSGISVEFYMLYYLNVSIDFLIIFLNVRVTHLFTADFSFSSLYTKYRGN